MKTSKALAKIISLALVLCMMFSFASCDMLKGMFKGSLELVSFTVDRSTVKTSYYLGDEINFTDIRAYAKYSDSSLDKEYTFSELTISYAPDITATEGQKEVKVSFQDPNLDTEVSATVLITVTEDPNAIKHDSYVVDATGMKTTYLIGDTLDFTGVKVIEKFTNGGADVEMTDLSTVTYDYASDITATPGIKTVLVKYNGENAGAISITVNRPGITAATLDTTGVTLEYLVGQTASFTGLKATITYENGQTATVTDFTFKTDLTTLTGTVGEKTVIVEFADELSGTTREASFKVKVDGIVDYTIDTTDMNLAYLEGETVSFAGIKVTAHYFFGKTEQVDFAALTFVHDANLTATAGNKTVTVKVGDTEAGTFIVAVGDIPTATANTTGVKLSYLVGDTVTLEGLTVTLKFNDGTADQTIALADLEVETTLTGLTATAGTKTITVKYQFDEYYLYADFNVTVYGITRYEVEGTIKGEYVAGKTYTVDYSDIKVYAVYGNGTRVLVDASGVTFSDTNATLTPGEKQIPVLVDGKDTQETVTLTVSRNVVKSVEVGGNFDNKYKLNETTNFSGIVVTITYADGTVATVTDLSLLTFKNAETNAVTNPTKTVTVQLTDEINDESIETTFLMVVTDNRQVSAFEQDSNINAFNSNNNPEIRYEYGQNGFSSQFAVGGQTYVIGDDNAFRYQPTFAFDKDGEDEYLTQYFADVTILVDGNALERRAVTNSITNYEYYLGTTKIATVDTYNGRYQFHTSLASVTISVMPSGDYYEVPADIKAVTLNAKVVDAYNVYEAWQLAVVDNYNSEWDDFKTDKGILNLGVNGIILHNDIKLTYKDVPSSFFYTSDKSVQYYNTVTGETKDYANTAGMNYLKDITEIYIHSGSADFVIEGNFFQIDADDFPLVASPSIFGDGERDYGGDYSNACLFKFQTIEDKWVPDENVSDISYVTINNLALRGNAGRDSFVIQNVDGEPIASDTELVTAGGLIMIKSSKHAQTTLNNVINNCFFISYFPDYQGDMIVNNSKCYDSYQNAAFVWADSTFTVNNSYINGTGGPVIITMSVNEEDVYYNPVTVINNTEMETHVSGGEIWFKAIKADVTVVPGIKALGAGLDQLVSTVTTALGTEKHASWIDKEGKMNIEAILMPAGNDVSALEDAMIQGTLNVGNTTVERWYTSPEWYSILSHSKFAAGCPFLTVIDKNGDSHTIYFVQEGEGGTFYNMNGEAIGASADTVTIIDAFATADQVILHQGGLSAIFELYH